MGSGRKGLVVSQSRWFLAEESVDQARWNGVNIWYYFNTLTGGPQGSLVKNATTPDGYKVGADGAWLQ